MNNDCYCGGKLSFWKNYKFKYYLAGGKQIDLVLDEAVVCNKCHQMLLCKENCESIEEQIEKKYPGYYKDKE